MFLSKTVDLHKQIEICREKLYLTLNSKGVFKDSDVIEVSQELDKLIVSLQKNIFNKRVS